MLAKIADVIEAIGLQVGAGETNVREGGFAQHVGGDILYRTIGDFMDEADIPVFARRHPGDDFAPCDFRIDDGLTAAAAVVDHHDEILHAGDLTPSA